MEEGLKIKIGADVVEVTKSFDKIEKNVNDFQKRIDNVGKSGGLDDLNKKIKETGVNMQAIKNASKVGFDDFGQKVKSLQRPVADASNTLMNFGRIAQDAPFGLIGITNNINPALESFQRLQKQTGSTGLALKSLLSGLAGPAGIGVAVSVVTAGVTSLVLKYGSLSNAITVLTSNLTNLQEAQRTLNSSFAESIASTEGERAKLTALFNIARGTSNALNVRKEAIDKLNSEYGRYLGNLTAENINTKKVNESYEKLNQTLINQAKIKGIQDLITEETKKQAQAFVQLNDALREQTGFGKIIQNIKDFNPVWRGAGISSKSADILRLGNEFDKSEEKIKLFNDSLQKLFLSEAESGNLFTKLPKQAKESVKKMTEYIQQGLTPIEIPLSIRDAKKKLGIEIKEIFHGIQSLDIPVSFGSGTILGEKATLGYMNFKKYWDEQAKKNPLYIEVEDKLQAIGGKYDKFFTESMNASIEKTKQFQKQLQNINEYVASELGNTFSDIFNIIATDGTMSFKKIGDAVTDFIKRLIAAAIRAAVVSVILKSLGKGGGIFNSIFSSMISGGGGVTGMASGGIVPAGFPNDTFPARLSSGEAVIPLDRLNSILGSRDSSPGVLQARVSGNDLLFVYERARRSQGRTF